MAHAYYTESNRGMTSTDTQKNAVYYVAKQVGPPLGLRGQPAGSQRGAASPLANARRLEAMDGPRGPQPARLRRYASRRPCGPRSAPNLTPPPLCLSPAPQFASPCSPEEFGVALAKHFVQNYPLVWKSKVMGEHAALLLAPVDSVVHVSGSSLTRATRPAPLAPGRLPLRLGLPACLACARHLACLRPAPCSHPQWR